VQRIFDKTSIFLSGALLVTAISAQAFAAFKDQSRIPSPQTENPVKKPPGSLLPDNLLPTDPVEKPENNDTPDKGIDNQLPPVDPEYQAEPYDINDIPELVPITLTIDIAKRAIDGFVDVGTRYDDKGLYDYPTLEAFVEKTDAGKQLEADIKKYGFKNIIEWNIAIMNVSYAYGALLQDQEQDIRRQIESVKQDKTLTPEKKKHIITSLNALIPSKENVKLIRELNQIPVYQEKLNLLNAFE